MARESPLTDQELWSLADRGGAELEDHVALHPGDRERVDRWRATIALARRVSGALPQRIGPYRVLGMLGQGGMGVVYEAQQAHPPRRVALKVMRAPASGHGRALTRFQREIEALARLSHPRIAVIHDAGTTTAGEPWFAMRLVPGRTLIEHADERSLDRRARLALFLDLCSAVEHAHAHGVLHRDLKPSNVIVDPEAGPVVLDFGLARLRETESDTAQLSTAEPIGTLAYASPEQARGDLARVAEPSDVFSLGAILFELLTGKLPRDLTGRPWHEAARIAAEEPARSPRAFDRSLPSDLAAIVCKALEFEPERRYASVAALAADVRAHLDGRPVTAREPSAAYRLKRFLRRHRLAALAVGSILLLATLASGALVFRPQLFTLGGDWLLPEKSPYDALRWVDARPQVRVDGRWYGLRSIDGFDVDYLIGYCRQEEPIRWRKRFSEDLLQVLNQLGDWAIWSVDLELLDLETGSLVALDDVPLSSASRRAIYLDRFEWPFRFRGQQDRALLVEFAGAVWELESFDGVPCNGSELSFDEFTERTGDSPSERVRFELRDQATGEVREFTDVPRKAVP